MGITYTGKFKLFTGIRHPDPTAYQAAHGGGPGGKAPVWSTASGLLATGQKNAPLTVSVSAADPEDQTVTYTLVSGALPDGMSLASNGTISGTLPNVLTTTTYTFGIAASDGLTASDRTFSIDVSGNNPPVWVTNSGVLATAPEGSSVSVTVSATDPDSDPVTYSITEGALPDGLSLNANTGAITGVLDEVESDTISNVTIAASDGIASVTRDFSFQTNNVLKAAVSFEWDDATANAYQTADTGNDLFTAPWFGGGAITTAPAPHGDENALFFTTAGGRLGSFSFLEHDFTIQFWMNPSSLWPNSDASTSNFSIQSATDGFHRITFGFNYNDYGKHYVMIDGSNSGATTAVGSGATYDQANLQNKWNHYAIMRTGGTNLILYINGVAGATKSLPGAWTPPPAGSYDNCYVTFNGDHDNLGTNGSIYFRNFEMWDSAIYTGNFTPTWTPAT